MPSDVLSRNPASAFGKRRFIARLFVVTKTAFRMSVEIRPVAIKGEHQKRLCIQPRGRNMLGREPSDRRSEGSFQLHESISPTPVHHDRTSGA